MFDYADGLNCKCNKETLNCGGSYIDSTQWLTNKKGTINQKIKMMICALSMQEQLH